MSFSFDLTGKNILVTGASSGIGRAIAIAAAERGSFVILSGRNLERLEETASCCGSDVVCEPFDLSISTQMDSIPRFVQSMTKKYGPLDGMVHSAGIAETIPLMGVRFQSFMEVFSVNAISALMLAKGFARDGNHQTTQSSIVFISSVAAHCGTTGLAAYSMSKGALESLAKTLAIELCDKKIRVNCVVPAMTETPMFDNYVQVESISANATESIYNRHPSGLGKPEDIAASCIYLLSDASRFVSGTNLFVDGGYSVFGG